MKISAEDISKIANLAKLKVSAADSENYSHEITKILSLVEEINQADTKNVQPMAHPLAIHQRLREDKVTETDEHEKFQSHAPKVEAGLYLVPLVVE